MGPWKYTRRNDSVANLSHLRHKPNEGAQDDNDCNSVAIRPAINDSLS
ncbi:hypothetical protein SPHINGO391_510027 [Sphingomonas aurantiaca]|uniref:Uncharacterized protein n=1 Tax=Sphingomonas aurantiaca TaxID=185949 RepID=A0A5E8ACN4_9SPHN|nr:hypothetical protein SPHINGO391_510027 [Sphingomonas aurantiaca]